MTPEDIDIEPAEEKGLGEAGSSTSIVDAPPPVPSEGNGERYLKQPGNIEDMPHGDDPDNSELKDEAVGA